MWDFRLLGRFEIVRDGQLVEIPSRQAQALLAYLLLHPKNNFRREKLAGLLWPDSSEKDARTNLRQVLYQVRGSLGKDLLLADRISIGINPEADLQLDTESLLAAKGMSSFSERLEALSLYQDELLPGFYEDWVISARDIYRQAFDALNQSVIDHLLQNYEWEKVVEIAEHWIARNKHTEAAYRSLMKAHAALSDTSSVVAVYQRCAESLSAGLDVAPSLETQELLEQLTQASFESLGRNPYRGLLAFREQDAMYFFGRDFFVSRTLNLMEQKSLVAISGSSGVGKTSVLLAGVLPVLKAKGLSRVAFLRPGNQPMNSFRSALNGNADHYANADGHTSVPTSTEILRGFNAQNPESRPNWIIIDQFEELFTLCPDPNIRKQFVDLILQLSNPGNSDKNDHVGVILSLRADFLSHLLDYRRAADALEEAIVVLGPMSNEEMRSAIQRPAEKAGAGFEVGLVERIMDDIGEEVSNLPLMEFALTELWERRANRTLTHKDYENIGKVEGAITRYAEKVFNSLSLSEQEKARKLFVQLVQPGQQTADTRRIATRKEIGDRDWPLVLRLAELRLLVTGQNFNGEETAEVIHEALISAWDRLRFWMETDRQFREWQEKLRMQINQWEASEKDRGSLLRGFSLTEAQNWIKERRGSLSKIELAFISHSIANDKRIREEREHLQKRIRNGLAIGFVTAIALAVVAGLALLRSVREERTALEAYSLSLAANAQQMLDSKDTVSALALALAANQIEDPPEASQVVLREAANAPGPRMMWTADEFGSQTDSAILSIAISPDETQLLVSASASGSVVLFDIGSGQLIRRLEGHKAYVTQVQFAPDGKHAITSSEDGTLFYWDLETGNKIHQLVGHNPFVQSVALSTDGRYAVSTGFGRQLTSIADLDFPGVIILWDLETGKEFRRLEGGHSQVVLDAEFARDDTAVLSVSGLRKASGVLLPESNLVLWDIHSGIPILDLRDVSPAPTRIAVSPDGDKALVGSMEGVVYEIDLSDGHVIQTLEGHPDWISDVNYTPDGQHALVSCGDGRITYWDLERSSLHLNGNIQEAEIMDIDVGASGRMAVSASKNGVVVLWDLEDLRLKETVNLHRDAISSIAFVPNTSTLITGSLDGSVKIWDIERSELATLFRNSSALTTLETSPDGKYLIVGFDDGLLQAWDMESKQLLQDLNLHTGPINSIAIDSSSHFAYSAGDDLNIIEWDLQALSFARYLNGSTERVTGLVMPPNDGFLFSVDLLEAILWDLETGEQIMHLPSTIGLFYSLSAVDISRSGEILVAGSGTFDNAIYVWDLNTMDNTLRLDTNDVVTEVAMLLEENYGLYSDASGNIVVFNAITGERLWVYKTADNLGVSTLAVFPDGNQVAVGLEDGELLILDTTILRGEELVTWAREHRMIREFSCVERAGYHIEPLCENEVIDADHVLMEPISKLEDLRALAGEIQDAHLGVNAGELFPTSIQRWSYEGEAGEILSIYANALQPMDNNSIYIAYQYNLVDTELVLKSPSGELLASNRGFIPEGEPYTTNAAIIEFTLPVNGTYRIEVSNHLQTSGGYKLILESLP